MKHIRRLSVFLYWFWQILGVVLGFRGTAVEIIEEVEYQLSVAPSCYLRKPFAAVCTTTQVQGGESVTFFHQTKYFKARFLGLLFFISFFFCASGDIYHCAEKKRENSPAVCRSIENNIYSILIIFSLKKVIALVPFFSVWVSIHQYQGSRCTILGVS